MAVQVHREARECERVPAERGLRPEPPVRGHRGRVGYRLNRDRKLFIRPEAGDEETKKVFSASYFNYIFELELELTQPHMALKPVLRGEVGARALRNSVKKT